MLAATLDEEAPSGVVPQSDFHLVNSVSICLLSLIALVLHIWAVDSGAFGNIVPLRHRRATSERRGPAAQSDPHPKLTLQLVPILGLK